MGSLGGIPNSRPSYVAESTELTSFPEDIYADNKVLDLIITRCGETTNSIREGIVATADLEDDVTADLFTQISADLDKNLYLLQAHKVV